MGEEKKEEGNKEVKEEKKVEEKKDESKEEPPPEIVLKVDMHCEACARKVAKALKGFQGVEDVTADSRTSKVVVKGTAADPIKVLERLQKKSGKKVELISPLPKAPEEKKEEIKEPPPKEEKKDEPPSAVTVVLKIRMHCEACAQAIQKRIRKIKGVESVETDLANDQVIVKGVIDPAKLVDNVYKRTKKQASIVKEEEKKVEEKKEEEKKEEKKVEEENKEQEEEEEDNKTEIKRSEYWPAKNYIDYAYDPEIFSDENPNACSVM
ncbi:heavy metal-associated isoprenylated plant protein 7-like [Vigna umbellata]|uniref:heavy metal-associated isoprenylated plant protein 7-like n=1 Tax=Vigna umbellata TaxID=87088 RepID=UPI001F5E4770|nr:heavy metal-associated isoprenylated plant protein 7-like [Vigna umbellata]